MWFKNLTVYRMTASWQLSAAQVEEAVSANAQTPIGLTQPVSTGWAPIFDGLFAHVVNRQILLQFKTEKKVVPSSALKAAVAERVDEVERMTGRKPGKKERREIKDDALLDLLPSALATISQTRVWIDPVNGWIVINTGSQTQADTIITSLVRSLEKLELQTLHIAKSPAAVMTEWLMNDDAPDNFTIDRACTLKACDDTKAVVKYTNSPLTTDNLVEHLRMGKVCKELALTWEDRISFVLTDTFRIKKVRALDLITEDRAEVNDEREASDADFALMTGEINNLLNALVAAFGGEKPRDFAQQGCNDLF